MNAANNARHRRAAPALLVLLAVLAAPGCGPAVRWGADAPAPPPDTRPRSVPGQFYTVQSGDTLYSIAWRHRLDWRDMADWNGLGDADLILPGQRLRLSPPPGAPPGRTAAAAPVPSPPSRDAGGASRPESGTAARVPAPERPSSPPAARPQPAPTQSGRDPAPQWQWPANGSMLYGFGDTGALGRGVGVGGSVGQPVLAAAPGRVVYTGSGLIGYGELVIIKHNDTWLSAYGHTRDVAVTEGDDVDSGQRIAAMGEGPGQRALVHFEIRLDGNPVDPVPLLPRR